MKEGECFVTREYASNQSNHKKVFGACTLFATLSEIDLDNRPSQGIEIFP